MLFYLIKSILNYNKMKKGYFFAIHKYYWVGCRLVGEERDCVDEDFGKPMRKTKKADITFIPAVAERAWCR